MVSYYKDEHPEIYMKEFTRIQKAIKTVQQAYDNNVFPYMRADATQYLDHIGHLESEGCFRCHSDRHKTKTGETISKSCDLCHTILAQGPGNGVQTVPLNSGMEFQHPVFIRGKEKTAMCSDCHKVLYE